MPSITDKVLVVGFQGVVPQTWVFLKDLRAEKVLAEEASFKERSQVAGLDLNQASKLSRVSRKKAKMIKLGEKVEKIETQVAEIQLKKLDVIQASNERIAAQTTEQLEKPETVLVIPSEGFSIGSRSFPFPFFA